MPCRRPLAVLLCSLCVWAGLPAPATAGEQRSALMEATATSACDATTEGWVRYIDASNRLELCDDDVWLPIAGSGSLALDDLTDSVTDYATDHNMRLGTNTAMFSGAANNLFIGESAGTAGTSNATDNNIAIGYQALDALTTGANNIAIGPGALGANTTSSGQVAIGHEALMTAATATGNTAVGYQALRLNQDGGLGNTALGYQALDASTTGDSNVAVGQAALGANTTGGSNTAVGYLALLANQTGFANTALGSSALQSSIASGNTAVGSGALLLATSNNNIALGYQAGDNITSGSSNIIIGYDINAPSATASSQLNIGDTIYADMANDFVSIGGPATPVSKFVVLPPAAQTIAATNTITANACGTIKKLDAASSVTTNTTNTFTAPTSSYDGCCMDVINVDTTDTITLDANANFVTIGGSDQALGPRDAVRVCSDGSIWYQMAAVAGNQ